jgi:RimJ/RimL family protein N-acetyltransferase
MEIYLRSLEAGDSALIYQWRLDPEITDLLGGPSFFPSREKELKWVEEKCSDTTTQLYLSICLIDSDAMIGYTSINNIDLRNRKAEWGGTIIGKKEYWGRGIAKTAALLMLKYLFEELGIHRCYAYCLAEHKVTVRLFKSLTFKQEGVLRDDLYKKGHFHDSLMFSLLRSEYVELMNDQR